MAGQSATVSSTRTFACPAGPCPRNLDFAVNGCTCNSQVYVDSEVSASYCCASGFADSQCQESLAEEAALEATFGATQGEVQAQLVSINFQGWGIKVHQKAEAAFKAVNERLKTVNYDIQEPIGSYDPRDVADSAILSTHAFGIAIDINPSTNPSCGVTRLCRCFNDLITDMPPEFVQAFKDEGFEWGGDWQDHPDP
ncbi:MAG: M15 family metallopeptidase, partial [Chloroflexota bacterium]